MFAALLRSAALLLAAALLFFALLGLVRAALLSALILFVALPLLSGFRILVIHVMNSVAVVGRHIVQQTVFLNGSAPAPSYGSHGRENAA